MKNTLNIGIAGVGTVGRGVLDILYQKQGKLSKKAGVPLNVVLIVDKAPEGKLDGLSLPYHCCISRNIEDLFADNIDIVVEMIGGTNEARYLIEESIKRKKCVVTANKAVLSLIGKEILERSKHYGVDVGIEASVAGGIPIIDIIRKDLIANHIRFLYGILNGTSNYVLGAMAEQMIPLEKALDEAKAKGYAEANPSLDISGQDAAHKLCVLMGVALDFWPELANLYVEGIENISNVDIKFGLELGMIIKLLAIAKLHGHSIELRVHPVMLPSTHLLSHVNQAFNAIYLDLDRTGPLLFYGQGAGRYPTASAVVADIVSIAKKISSGSLKESTQGVINNGQNLNIIPMEEVESEFYLRFMLSDVPGMIGQIAITLGRNKVSISQVIQKERKEGKTVPVVLITHKTREAMLRNALQEIYGMQGVLSEPVRIIRIERFTL